MASSRREFIKATAGALAAIPAGCSVLNAKTAEAPKAVVVRREIFTLDKADADLDAYRKAVTKLKDNDLLLPVKVPSWQGEMGIHGPMLGDFGACRHGSWFFLPWHRAYLQYFEEIVCAVSGKKDFALPYWDWVKNPTMPGEFFNSPLDNPVRPDRPGSGRKASLTPQTTFKPDDLEKLIGVDVVEGMLNQPNFLIFGGTNPLDPGGSAAGTIEGSPHNLVHRWVGGDMVTGGSPYDPIFWLHHCNVDRLWSEWMRRHQNGMPADATFRNEKFGDFVDASGQAVTSMTVTQLLDTTNLGYRYPEGAEAQLSSFRTSPPTRLLMEPLNLKDKPSVEDPSAASFVFARDSQATMRIADVLQKSKDSKWQSVELRLIGIPIPANMDVVLSVFVNCKKLAEVTPEDPSYVGSCTFFGHGHAHTGPSSSANANTTSFIFDAAPAFGKLYGNRTLSADEPLKVTVVAKPLFPDEKNAWKGKVTDVSPTQVSIRVVSNG